MSSNVGSAAVYEAGDQRNKSEEEKKQEEPERFDEGKDNSHKATDAKDERSIANRLENETAKDDDPSASGKATKVDKLAQEDPTAPARLHGNEPSRGAKIDADILKEEQELIAKMDAKK
ncbi:MAG: hypothetical protein GOMPHAMPRED_007501 [Gomphillus americanus]|uniref:Uncharacterized protein n=1 Tax=Gomphillus americanus TaxID=1940652 RepID=A0A8H3ES83_9LECA|nr:MAG: hypothetical protein GOMPHAMPRED_007501 [Gomphillus americanus]